MENREPQQRAVLLDMDGVVIDGMPFHLAAWQHAFRSVAQAELPAQSIYLSEGWKEEQIIGEFCRELGLNLPPSGQEEILRAKRAHYNRIFRLQPMTGIRESLALMQELGCPLALVTGAQRAAAERALSELGVRACFAVVSGCDNVQNGKPSGEPYLKAAEALGIRPEYGLVIENAPAGVQSARAAGMTCIALQTSLGREYLRGADVILADHAELQALLKKEHALSGGCGRWQVPLPG